MIPKSLLVVDILTLETVIPVEWIGPKTLSEILPIEWTLPKPAPLPVEWRQALSLLEQLLVEWRLGAEFLVLSEIVPVEYAGEEFPGLRWNVIAPLLSPVLFSWDVLNQAVAFTVQFQWNVLALLAGVTVRWDVLPDIFTPFGVDPTTGEAIPPTSPPAVPTVPPASLPTAPPSGIYSEDVQRPVATKDKTP